MGLLLDAHGASFEVFPRHLLPELLVLDDLTTIDATYQTLFKLVLTLNLLFEDPLLIFKLFNAHLLVFELLLSYE